MPHKGQVSLKRRAAKHGDNCELCKPPKGKWKSAPAVATVSGYRVCKKCWETVYVIERQAKRRAS